MWQKMTVAASTTALLLCGCGEAVATAPGHDRPSATVLGFLDALRHNRVGDLAQWIQPKDRNDFAIVIAEFQSAGASFSVQGPSPAVVSESIDSSNSQQASVVMASGVKLCEQLQNSSPSCSSLDVLNTVEVNSQWYLTKDSVIASGSTPSASSTAVASGSPLPAPSLNTSSGAVLSGVPAIPTPADISLQLVAGSGTFTSRQVTVADGWSLDYVWDCTTSAVPAGSQLHIAYKAQDSGNTTTGDIRQPEQSSQGLQRNHIDANNGGTYVFTVTSSCSWGLVVIHPPPKQM